MVSTTSSAMAWALVTSQLLRLHLSVSVRQMVLKNHPFRLSYLCKKTPAGRWLEPEELAGPAVFLASDASNAVNGHILYVDGGILAYIGKQPK